MIFIILLRNIIINWFKFILLKCMLIFGNVMVMVNVVSIELIVNVILVNLILNIVF